MLRTRIFVALGASAVINVTWLLLDGLTGQAQQPNPRLVWIVDKLGAPGATMADWLAPSGHSMGTILGGVLIAIVSSVVFYASVVWMVLSVPAWWREVRQSRRVF